MSWLVMPAAGSCIDVGLLPPDAPAKPINITKPVGIAVRCRNLAVDVKTIQAALNRVTVKGLAGGAMPFLDEDGLYGPKTRAAIANFQRVQLKFCDEVVDTDGKTMERLNVLLEPVAPATLVDKVASALPFVVAMLGAAIANLTAIQVASEPLATTARDRLSRHFRFDTLAPEEQARALILLMLTYQRLFTVAARPGTFDLGAVASFDIDERNPKIALTQAKGFLMFNQEDHGRRLDKIHLGRGFFDAKISAPFAAFIITHELAHFVGRSDGVLVKDHGRGWFDQEFIKPLPAAKRLANADSYASFAQECGSNSAVKPEFVKTAPGGLGGAR